MWERLFTQYPRIGRTRLPPRLDTPRHRSLDSLRFTSRAMAGVVSHGRSRDRMSLQELVRQRREKLAKWRALGVEPYAYRFEATHHAADLIARAEAVTETPGDVVR